jgi:hypothetical protein
MAVQVQQQPPQPPSADRAVEGEPPRKPRLWRRASVAILLILGAILTPVAVLVTYAKTQVLDTDRYVATVKPLASDPAIQNYVADQVSSSLLAQIDVKAYVDDALSAFPPRAQGLSGPITTAVQTFVHEAALRVVQSPAFQQIWTQGNRAAHAQMVKVLTNEGGVVKVERSGAVKVDLKGVAGVIQKQLVSSGLPIADKIPLDRVNGSVTIFQSEELYKARRGAEVLDKVGYALPLVVLACLGGAVLLSVRKRRAFIKAAVAFAFGALILALLVNGARHFYLEALPKSVPEGAAAAIYDTLLRSLHTSARNILLVAIVIAVAAFVSGPARPAVGFRNWWARAVTWAGADADRAGWGVVSSNAWMARSKRLLRVILAVVLFVAAFRWPHPTTAVILWLVILGLVGLAVIDFYGREPVTASSPPMGEGEVKAEA